MLAKISFSNCSCSGICINGMTVHVVSQGFSGQISRTARADFSTLLDSWCLRTGTAYVWLHSNKSPVIKYHQVVKQFGSRYAEGWHVIRSALGPSWFQRSSVATDVGTSKERVTCTHIWACRDKTCLRGFLQFRVRLKPVSSATETS